MAWPARPAARAVALSLALAVAPVAAAGCGDGDDGALDGPAGTTISPAGADAGHPDDGGDGTGTGVVGGDSGEGEGDGSDGSDGGGGGARSRIDVDRSDTSSELERRVSETLSELDVEQRGADTVVVLPDRVLFDFGEHDLRPEAIPVLDGLVEAMTLYADAPVKVHGHTDAIGSDAANQALSERRAGAVRDHFVDAGIDPARVHAQGFGETQPVAPNTHPDGSDDPEGRARNRRVEIVLEGVDAGS
ncbi:MAG TPA: OmpA family protein [Acidimicrobiales bacterium]